MKIKITKKHAIIGIAVIMLIGVGFFFLGGAQSEDSSAGVKAEKSAEVVKDAADNGEKAVDKDKKTETNKSEKADKNEATDKKSNATSEKDSNSSSNSGSSGNKNNSSSSSNSNSGNKSNSSSSTSEKPTHTHNWVAVYETQYVKTIQVCSNCQQDITANYYEHGQAHALAGESSGRYSKPIYDDVLVGYKCSCGATK